MGSPWGDKLRGEGAGESLCGCHGQRECDGSVLPAGIRASVARYDSWGKLYRVQGRLCIISYDCNDFKKKRIIFRSTLCKTKQTKISSTGLPCHPEHTIPLLGKHRKPIKTCPRQTRVHQYALGCAVHNSQKLAVTQVSIN